MRYLFKEEFERYYKFLVLVGSPYAGRFWEASHSVDFAMLEASLEQLGFPVSELPSYKQLKSSI